ncbi:hypothetical protein [Mucilaginibacter sp.]|uniref:hypothetical protein n=1 Tax=Mucilaginibacter sp. TaxID=1882438 RepID=UPI002607718F|nr:hypothetical protein [Mucilaginibacter sp.]
MAAVEINTPAKNCTPLAALKMKCCKDKKVDVKIKDAHQGESQSNVKAVWLEMTKIPFWRLCFIGPTNAVRKAIRPTTTRFATIRKNAPVY